MELTSGGDINLVDFAIKLTDPSTNVKFLTYFLAKQMATKENFNDFSSQNENMQQKITAAVQEAYATEITAIIENCSDSPIKIAVSPTISELPESLKGSTQEKSPHAWRERVSALQQRIRSTLQHAQHLLMTNKLAFASAFAAIGIGIIASIVIGLGIYGIVPGLGFLSILGTGGFMLLAAIAVSLAVGLVVAVLLSRLY